MARASGVTFRILGDRGLVYVCYRGHARVADTAAAFDAYARHPAFRPGQRQLVDLTQVTGIERDFAAVMVLQARIADVFLGVGTQTLLAYIAPDGPARRMAALVARSWEGVPTVVARIFETEEAALAFLGQAETRVADLLAGAG